MIHLIARSYRDPQTGVVITRVFRFEAETEEQYQTRLEEALSIPLPGEPIKTDGEYG